MNLVMCNLNPFVSVAFQFSTCTTVKNRKENKGTQLFVNEEFLVCPFNRLLVVLRLIALFLFLSWRVRNPNQDAIWLWGMSIVCEIWFAFSWLLDQLPKLNPINRATDLAALHDKFEQRSPLNPHGRSDLPGVDVFVSTADPEKEPPLVTANTILSILAVDYPVEKLACYISDDGAAILTFEAMAEAVNFAEVCWILKIILIKFAFDNRRTQSYEYIFNRFGFLSAGNTTSSLEIQTVTSTLNRIQRRTRNGRIS